MGEGSGRVFNLISIIFVLLTIVVLVLGLTRLLGPAPTQSAQVAVPTMMSLPTLTPSFTPSDTPPPTRTPLPTWTPTPEPSITPTQLPTWTPQPTATVTPTITLSPTPTLTPTQTLTPTSAFTETATSTVTPTQSPFPFTLRNNQIAFTSNFANTAGCQWQGLGGNVFDMSAQPLPRIRVHVYNGVEVDLFSESGSNTLYGQAGWEIQVANTINAGTYFVELQSPDGTLISPTVQVTFPGSCEGNTAIVNFEQTRPF
jgi:hypothetical protein